MKHPTQDNEIVMRSLDHLSNPQSNGALYWIYWTFIRKDTLRYLFVVGNNGAKGLWRINKLPGTAFLFDICLDILNGFL